MVKIKPDAKTSYPSWQDFSEMFPDEKDDDAFNDALDELTGEDPENPDDRSQLLGWPDVIQNSMFDECDLVTQGYYLGNGWLNIPKEVCPFPLLPDRKISDKMERKGELNNGN